MTPVTVDTARVCEGSRRVDSACFTKGDQVNSLDSEGGHAPGIYRHALAAAGVGSWVLDAQADTVQLDAGASGLLSLPGNHPQALSVDSFIELFDEVDQDRLRQEIAAAVDGSSNVHTAARRAAPHADGGAVHLALRGRRLAEADGILVGGACWDITDTKRLEDKLVRLSVRDSLTNLYNRRYFDENIEREWKIGLREKLPLSLGFIDVDHFKNYNDTLGHQTGDRCLIRIANAIRSALVRPADFVARYGGEEFVFVLPNTGTEGARHVAQRVQDAIASERIPHPASPVGPWVTVSVGVATITEDDFQLPLSSLIQRADDAMYAAKSGGRNAIVSWEASLPTSQRKRVE